MMLHTQEQRECESDIRIKCFIHTSFDNFIFIKSLELHGFKLTWRTKCEPFWLFILGFSTLLLSDCTIENCWHVSILQKKKNGSQGCTKIGIEIECILSGKKKQFKFYRSSLALSVVTCGKWSEHVPWMFLPRVGSSLLLFRSLSLSLYPLSLSLPYPRSALSLLPLSSFSLSFGPVYVPDRSSGS